MTTGMRLGDLAAGMTDVQLVGDAGTSISGVRHDSREVEPGDLFVCIPGGRHDGHAFIGDAVARGAAALVVARDRQEAVPSGLAALVVGDPRLALAEASAAVYGQPSRSMRLVGVTGTNGKSTSVAMICSIAEAAGLAAGRIGTLGAVALGRALPCAHTTPEADDLQRLLAEMRAMGVEVAAMEVSSHGLSQKRSDCIDFLVGLFTNATHDHLDYHGSFANYLAAKLRLFREYPAWSTRGFTAVVNMDDPHGDVVAREARGDVLRFGRNPMADVRAEEVRLGATSTSFRMTGVCGNLEINLPIGGAFQVANALGAASAALALGLPSSAIVQGLATMQPVPGRFEAVPTGRPWDVIVDFAHTPDGLRSLLESARALNPARIILLMGCGGNRDRAKRPVMGAIAGNGADVVVVTSDNPRLEDPSAIIADILEGMRDVPAEVVVEPDRRAATLAALRMARPGDLVVLAGKGGETEMIVGDERIPYDDRIVVREMLELVP